MEKSAAWSRDIRNYSSCLQYLSGSKTAFLKNTTEVRIVCMNPVFPDGLMHFSQIDNSRWSLQPIQQEMNGLRIFF